jgi:aspartyl-tRNA synthetase
MNGQYEDQMMSAPSEITPEQLKVLHIKLDMPKEKVKDKVA